VGFEVIATPEAALALRNLARMRFPRQVAGQMTLKAFEVSKATSTPRNAAFELSPLNLPRYAVAIMTQVATDEACEFLEIVPGGCPPLTIGYRTE
jgi:hypothetical protein